LQKQGNYDDSVELLREIEPIFDKLGPTNEKTLVMKSNLAALLYRLEKFAESNSRYEELLPLFKQRFGTNRLNTWNLLASMADSQMKQGRDQKAIGLLLQLHDMNPQHFSAAVRDRVKGLRSQNEDSRAEALLKQLLAKLPADCAERKALQEQLDEIRKPK
jgi:tetratricopeptide (TPR) repeat protein